MLAVITLTNATHIHTIHLYITLLTSLVLVPTFLLPLQAAKEHYQLLKEDYQAQVEKLTKLVDSGVDPVMFLAASGELSHCTQYTLGPMELTRSACEHTH